MKKINNLIKCDYDLNITTIEEDSRIKAPNSLFCCIEGLTVDGHDYVNNAIKNGAVAVIASKDIDVKVPVIRVDDTNKAMGEILSNFYDNADKKLKLIGVTGTDGKTTLTTIIYQLMNNFTNSGLIGTNGVICDFFEKESNFTTPFPKQLYSFLNDFYQAGCKYVTMETTSERLGTNRLSELQFDIAIYTNLSTDHLNTHKSMENYAGAKSKLFSLLKETGYAIINNDDDYSQNFIEATPGKVLTYGIDKQSDIMAKDIVITEKLLTFTLTAPYGEYKVISPLSGKFNVYNLMGAITTCYVLGFNVETVIEKVALLQPIDGREQYVECGQPFKVMVDYAHTGNALKNLLEYTKTFCKGKVIIVTGSGGLRDINRRIDIGETVTALANHVIFTSEDPRTEDPLKIIGEMLSTVKDKTSNYEIVLDREKAIQRALDRAEAGDLVLLAGKSNEAYMEIGTEMVPYITDAKVAEQYLQKIFANK